MYEKWAVDARDLTAFCALSGAYPLDPETVTMHAPDASWMVGRQGHPEARCSLWWRQVPHLAGQRLGLVGHYSAVHRGAALELLAHAVAELRAAGCTQVIAPIDGSTWRNYRLLCERGSEPRFFLEPDNPDHWVDDFAAAGFRPLARYYSSLGEDVQQLDLPQPTTRHIATGATVRPIDPGDADGELTRIWAVATEAFRDNFLYSPIAREEFVATCRPLFAELADGLSVIAEDRGRPVGFCFSLPDRLQVARSGVIDTVVVKTTAVLPAYRNRKSDGVGVGRLLLMHVLSAAHARGYRRRIHPLMYAANVSYRVDRDRLRDIRRYDLYAVAA